MRIVGVNEAGSGGVANCLLDPRNVLKFGIVSNASAILLSHNHPSGDPTPSAEDQDLTRAIVASCGVVGLPLVDHVIVAPGGGFYSMRDHGDAGL
jgi:DNA repair protein RadC